MAQYLNPMMYYREIGTTGSFFKSALTAVGK